MHSDYSNLSQQEKNLLQRLQREITRERAEIELVKKILGGSVEQKKSASKVFVHLLGEKIEKLAKKVFSGRDPYGYDFRASKVAGVYDWFDLHQWTLMYLIMGLRFRIMDCGYYPAPSHPLRKWLENPRVPLKFYVLNVAYKHLRTDIKRILFGDEAMQFISEQENVFSDNRKAQEAWEYEEEQSIFSQCLYHCMERLTPITRQGHLPISPQEIQEILLLKHVDGFTLNVIGRIYETSPPTMHRWIGQAEKQLYDCLKVYCPHLLTKFYSFNPDNGRS